MRSMTMDGPEMTRAGASEPGSGPAAFGPDWSALEREIRGCVRCSLHATRTKVVIYRGSPTPRVLFVGEAPGATEDRLGVPFVGRSGQRLDAALAEAAIPADQVGMLNVVKCRPPKNLFDRTAAATCRPYLERQIALLRPPVLVSLGSHALQALDPTAPRVLIAAGHPRPRGARTLFPLIHPAAAMRSRALTERWRVDFAALGSWLANPEGALSREPI
jgi:uracil-DNA glycosylase